MAHKHKNHSFHLKRVALFGVLLTAFFVVRLDAGSLPRPLQSVHVLAYSTEMSQSNLLSGTNASRSANGLGPLTLNNQLSTSAQMKAQDMADKNYWAHVAPDGTQPWYFFERAGYAYIRAGENLAYGFNTSQGAVDGWMNSPSHRANILGEYTEVGFGFVNAPDYQSSGQQTIVVAHYGSTGSSPTPSTPVAQPAAPTSSAPPSPAPTSPVTAPDSPTGSADAVPVAPPAETTPTATADTAPPAQPIPKPAATIQTGSEADVTLLSMMASKNLSIAAIASLAMVSFAIAGYALTHRAAFRQTVTAGEHFVVRHPGIDTVIVAAVTSLILLTSYGRLV